jgi:REP element-mobilizing transposase RayT
MEPIYTAENCTFSYPLQWGLTIFWLQDQSSTEWLNALRESLKPDGIRLLSHRLLDIRTSQFAVSTTPSVSPSKIVQRVKGRLQYLVRESQPKPFRRNFAIRSFGSEERSVIERYVATQTEHHSYADPGFQAFLERIQIHDSAVDLSLPMKTSHGLYWYNLHVVLVHRERWKCTSHSRLNAVRQMILRIGPKKEWRISRAGILPDHVHAAIGCGFEDSPQDVVLCYLNNLAFVHEMKPVFQFGGFVGTFGDYDNRVVHGDRVET